ncbi:2,5-diamino-6-(ribosylamino)-4(3H)-pyrimidinone 5'-phosphate reductase [Phlyctochytrium bullatum]|nr:2,5-diamino-6-(ribosylamino)-4(3H)-pyrimidinone 5'-phosphate reductase [Phlyctochytrium bullatum]
MHSPANQDFAQLQILALTVALRLDMASPSPSPALADADAGVELQRKAFAFLHSAFASARMLEAAAGKKPAVILTYAQGLDGTIGHNHRSPSSSDRHEESSQEQKRPPPLIISGPESLVMTHALRACCDGILVGVGTVTADNPLLNVRLVPREAVPEALRLKVDQTVGQDLPRPVILDSRLRIPPDARILARNPVVFCRRAEHEDYVARAAVLRERGATVVPIPSEGGPDGPLDLHAVFAVLHEEFGMRRVMVEGGSTVIQALLKRPSLVDLLIVTVAPTIYAGGVRAYAAEECVRDPPARLRNPTYVQFGCDMVMAATF